MDEQTGPAKSNTKMMAIGIIALIIIAAIGVGVYQGTSKQPANQVGRVVPTTMTQPTTTTAGQPSPSASVSASAYKDGSYSVTGDYISPGGAEELGVTLTLKNGVITDSVVEPKATRPNSVRFQGIFAENYKPLVIGKNINDVQLAKVSGSSLAPKGFNDAVEKIKAEAKS
jgi:hypothetical protein